MPHNLESIQNFLRDPVGSRLGRPQRNTDPGLLLEQITRQLQARDNPGIIRAAGGDIKELLAGIEVIGGAVLRDAWNIARIPKNLLEGDDETVSDIMGQLREHASFVPEAVKGELDFLKETYGSAFQGDFEPIQEFIRNDPLFFAMDLAAVFSGGASALGSRGTAATGRGLRGVAQLVKEHPIRPVFERIGGRNTQVTPAHRPLEALTSAEKGLPGEGFAKLKALTESDRLELARGKSEVIDTAAGVQKFAKRFEQGEKITQREVKRAAIEHAMGQGEYLALPMAERLNTFKVLAGRMGEAASDLNHATVLNYMSSATQLGNPFRLAWATIGKMPGVNRLQALAQNRTEALGKIKLANRLTDSLRALWAADLGAAIAPFKSLTPDEQIGVLRVGQGLVNRYDDLTEMQKAAFDGLRDIGERQRPGIVRLFMERPLKSEKERLSESAAHALLDRRIKAEAISGEAIEQLKDTAGMSNGELKMWTLLSKLRNADRLVQPKMLAKRRAVQAENAALRKDIFKQINAPEGHPDWVPPDQKLGLAKAAARLDEKMQNNNRYLQVAEMAEERLRSGELMFIPGVKDYLDLTQVSGVFPSLSVDAVVDITENVSIPVAPTLRKKTTIATPEELIRLPEKGDILPVENAFLRYVDSLGIMHGRMTILNELKMASTSIDSRDLERALKSMGAVEVVREVDKVGFELVKLAPSGQVVALPKGMKTIYESALRRSEVSEAAQQVSQALNFTRAEFSNIVLGLSPHWPVFNILGNTFLYTLGGGSPAALAKELGLTISGSLKKVFKKAEDVAPEHKHLRLRSLLWEEMNKEYRRGIPHSMALGFTGVERKLHTSVEYMSKAELLWREGALTKFAQKYLDFTERMVNLPNKVGLPSIPRFNEVVEEMYRNAMFLTGAKRAIRAKHFAETGVRMQHLNSPQMQARLTKLAAEFDPERLTRFGSNLNLSAEAKSAMDFTNKFLNDYYGLGPVERSIFRNIMPFYSWTKFVNRLALQLPLDHPIRLSMAAHMSNTINDIRGTDDTLPEWLQNMVEVEKNPDGTTTFQSGQGFNVFTGLLFSDEGLNQAVMGISPVLQVPIELFSGINLMRAARNRVAPSRGTEGLLQSSIGKETFRISEEGLEEVTPRPSLALALIRGGLVPIPFWRSIERSLRGGPHDDIGSVTELGMELGRKLTGGPRQYPGAFIDSVTKQPFETPARETFFREAGTGRFTFDKASLQKREIEKKLSAAKRIIKDMQSQGLVP